MAFNRNWRRYLSTTWPPRFLLGVALSAALMILIDGLGIRPFHLGELFNIPVAVVVILAVWAIFTDPVLPDEISEDVRRPPRGG